VASTLSGETKQDPALGLGNAQVGLAGSAYRAGAVWGVFFGWPTDRLGRKSRSPTAQGLKPARLQSSNEKRISD
jgi:hypothetical protein